MTTPRKLLNIVDPDHQFKTTARTSSGSYLGAVDRVIYRFTCTCGYRVSYVETLEFANAWPDVAKERSQMWLHIQRLEHLLDQDVDMQEVNWK